MQASNLQQEANLISRMERMPLNKALLTLVGLLSWCWVMEAFDLGMIGQVVAVLKKIWDLDASTLGLLGSCSTAGVVIGTASAGFLTCLLYTSEKYRLRKKQASLLIGAGIRREPMPAKEACVSPCSGCNMSISFHPRHAKDSEWTSHSATSSNWP